MTTMASACTSCATQPYHFSDEKPGLSSLETVSHKALNALARPCQGKKAPASVPCLAIAGFKAYHS